MDKIDHGDLIEQRHGDVETLRVMVATLEAHHQSGAIRFQANEGHQTGWLLVRLGQPVMASLGDESGLEALLSIEQLCLRSGGDFQLYELSVSQIRKAQQHHPEAVLDLASSVETSKGEWWANTPLPITGWRRTSNLAELDGLDLRTDTRPRTKQRPRRQEQRLSPGGVYLHDSPDPHALLNLGVELAGRGMPLLGLFALPFAETETTRRLPTPSCFALFRSIDGLATLSSQEAMIDELHRFLWESERSVVVLNGLDRIGNALGDQAMMALFRLVVDHVQMGDHALLCTTDLGVFDAMTQHNILGESELLVQHDIDAWLHDTDALLDHPLLIPDADDELMWMEAHLNHHNNETSGDHQSGIFGVEGGSVEVNDEARQEATSALKGLVNSWPQPGALNTTEPTPSGLPPEAIGSTPWQVKPLDGVRPPRHLSDIPLPEQEEAPPPVPEARTRRPRATFVRPKTPRGPRRPQRMKARKPSPRLPDIQMQSRPSFSKDTPSDNATFDEIRGQRATFASDGLAASADRMDQHISSMKRSTPFVQRELRDAVRNSTDASSPKPTVRRSKTLHLAKDDEAMLKGRRQPSGPVPNRRTRESSNRAQHHDDLEALHKEWVARKEQSQFRTTALYDEHGRPLRRFGSGQT